MAPIRVGDGHDPVLQVDPAMGLWRVGVLEAGHERLMVALIEPLTGDVIAVIERPLIRGEDPNGTRPD